MDAPPPGAWSFAGCTVLRVVSLRESREEMRDVGLSTDHITIVGLLPLVSIVTALTMLNLQHVVFRIMGGLRDEDRSPHDDAHAILFMRTWLSIWTVIPLLLAYLGLVVKSLLERRKKVEGATESSPRLPRVFASAAGVGSWASRPPTPRSGGLRRGPWAPG